MATIENISPRSPPVAVPASPPKRFFYIDAFNEIKGPHSTEELLQVQSAGTLSPSSIVCAEGQQEWIELRNVLPRQNSTQGFAARVPNVQPRAGGVNPSNRSSVAPRINATMAAVANPPSFGSWYRPRLGSLPLKTQILAWVCGGYVWILLWWAFSKGSPALAKWIAIALLTFPLVMIVLDKAGIIHLPEHESSSLTTDPSFLHGYLFAESLATTRVRPSESQLDQYAQESLETLKIPDYQHRIAVYKFKQGYYAGLRSRRR